MTKITDMRKIEVVAPLNTEVANFAQIADILSLPAEDARQPDLQYLTAIFVSSGMNKNGAVFLGSELINARGTINDKAVDLEHDEQTVVGQITGSAFLNRDRSPLDVERATMMNVEELDDMDMDVAISAIIHKARFPGIANEILEGQWMVSMEAYYRDFDVKVGNMIIPREQAENMGFDKLVGSVVQLRDGEKEMGFHLVGRVLRDIIFAGVGLVRNPANPRSVIMEAAAVDEYVEERRQQQNEIKIINMADIETLLSTKANNTDVSTEEFISRVVRDAVKEALNTADVKKESPEEKKEEAKENLNHILPGTCRSYKRYVYTFPEDQLETPENDLTQYPLYTQPGDGVKPPPGAEVAREHYCNLFDLDCAARPGDATLPTCWRNVFARTMREEITTHEQVLRRTRIQEGLVSLQNLLDDARKFVS